MEVIMPIIQSALGLVSIFVDSKKKSKRWLLFLMVVLLIASAGITIVLDKSESAVRENQFRDLKASNDQLREDNHEMKSYLLTIIQGFGFTKLEVSHEDIAQSIEADKGLRTLVKTSPTSQGVILVEYFPKDVDTNIVAKELQALGFRFKPKSPVNNLPTNAIWVGDRVSISDAQKVALALLRAGVRLHSINRFHDGSGPKSLLIQVGADPGVLSWPVLTASDIISMKELKRFPS